MWIAAISDMHGNAVAFEAVIHDLRRQSPDAIVCLVVNTGSVGLPFDGDNRASYAVIDIEGGNTNVQLRRVPYDIEKAIHAAQEQGMPDIDAFEYALRRALSLCFT